MTAADVDVSLPGQLFGPWVLPTAEWHDGRAAL